jgi:hypothetical protein
MPVRYRYDSNIVVIELVDEYSMDDLRMTVLRSLDDPVCPANSFLIINLTESRSIYKRSTDDIKSMAHFVASLGNRFNGRIALVAPGYLPYGLMRMSSVGSEDRQITSEVFRTFAEARKWILSGRPGA